MDILHKLGENGMGCETGDDVDLRRLPRSIPRGSQGAVSLRSLHAAHRFSKCNRGPKLWRCGRRCDRAATRLGKQGLTPQCREEAIPLAHHEAHNPAFAHLVSQNLELLQRLQPEPCSALLRVLAAPQHDAALRRECTVPWCLARSPLPCW